MPVRVCLDKRRVSDTCNTARVQPSNTARVLSKQLVTSSTARASSSETYVTKSGTARTTITKVQEAFKRFTIIQTNSVTI